MSRRGRFLDDSAGISIAFVLLSFAESSPSTGAPHCHVVLVLRRRNRSGWSHAWGARARRGERSSRIGRSQIGDFFTKFYSDKSSEGSIAGGAIKPELSTLRFLSDGGSKWPRSDRRDRRERDTGRLMSRGWRGAGDGSNDGINAKRRYRGSIFFWQGRDRAMARRRAPLVGFPTTGSASASHAFAETRHGDRRRTRLNETN